MLNGVGSNITLVQHHTLEVQNALHIQTVEFCVLRVAYEVPRMLDWLYKPTSVTMVTNYRAPPTSCDIELYTIPTPIIL